MRRPPRLLLALPSICLSTFACGQALDAAVAASEARLELRKPRSAVEPSITMSTPQKAAQDAAPATSYLIKLGGSYADDGRGAKGIATPVQLRATLPGQRTSITATGDGLKHTHAAGASASGVADVSLTLMHRVAASLPLQLGAGLRAGSGSAVGSDSHAVYGQGSWRQTFGMQFAALALVRATREFHHVPVGSNPRLLSATALLQWSPAEIQWLNNASALVSRGKRQDGPGRTFATLSAEFEPALPFGVEVSVTRDLTGARRSTALGTSLIFSL